MSTTPQSAAVYRRLDAPNVRQLWHLGELWQYRELLYFLAWRDVKVRYKQTFIGAAWAILQPLLLMTVFSLVLGRFGRPSSDTIPYPVFLYAGLLPWFFFATATTRAANSVIGSENLITKIYFPRLALPIAAGGPALVDLMLAQMLLLAMMLWCGIAPGLQILLAPVLLLFLAQAALGVGTLLAALNVAYRDFRHVLPFLIQLWLLATPSVYLPQGSTITNSTLAGASGVSAVLQLNPLTNLIAALRACILGTPVDVSGACFSAICCTVLFVVGCTYFCHVEKSFADVI